MDGSIDRGKCSRAGDVKALLSLLGKSHSLEILGSLSFSEGPVRFGQIRDQWNIPANTLSRRLKELEAAQIIVREAVGGCPPVVEYSLSELGEGTRKFLGELFDWVESIDQSAVIVEAVA